ncbi:hypothetical protein ILYODFUR_030566 [Ilyodon furcidens]|uniref:Uncharacterized protein n=1 Tax=Ilyodon furcidens TaxID=33524 RepID=A0ABV0UXJ9_9TELE
MFGSRFERDLISELQVVAGHDWSNRKPSGQLLIFLLYSKSCNKPCYQHRLPRLWGGFDFACSVVLWLFVAGTIGCLSRVSGWSHVMQLLLFLRFLKTSVYFYLA